MASEHQWYQIAFQTQPLTPEPWSVLRVRFSFFGMGQTVTSMVTGPYATRAEAEASLEVLDRQLAENHAEALKKR